MIWAALEARQPTVARADRCSLVDPQQHWTSTTGPSTTADGRPTARNWPMSFSEGGDWNWHGLGADSSWLAATSAHPAVLCAVESIIGGPIKRPTRNRGIYCAFPHAEPAGLSPHHGALPEKLRHTDHRRAKLLDLIMISS